MPTPIFKYLELEAVFAGVRNENPVDVFDAAAVTVIVAPATEPPRAQEHVAHDSDQAYQDSDERPEEYVIIADMGELMRQDPFELFLV